MGKKKLTLLTCGGTIASIPEEKSHLSAEELLEYGEPAARFYEVETMECFCQDSANLCAQQWPQLAGMIREQAEKTEGIVVAHGTDTLAYTAAMLSWMLEGIPVPVVLTGAQRPLIYPESDGLSNLRSAFAMAASGVTGVFTAFHDHIFLGTHTVKIRSTSMAAFDSPGIPPVAVLNAQGLQIHWKPSSGTFVFAPGLCEQVFLWKLTPSADPSFADYLMDSGYRGIVVEGYGKGSVPTSANWQRVWEGLRKKDIPVVVCGQSQMEPAPVNPADRSPYWIAGHGMTTEGAVTRLMWVLGQPGVPGMETVRKRFLDTGRIRAV